MRVLITGGAGFIGSHIAEACRAAGHDVVVLDNLSTGRRGNLSPDIALAEGDLRDAAFVSRTFADFRPEVVSHQGAQTSVAVSAREPILDAEINVLGSLNVLGACVEHEVGHCIFASTGGAIYGEVPEGREAGTDWQPRPLSPYACSKFSVESYLVAYGAEHGLRSTVLRYANVYGPKQDPHGEAGVVAIFGERFLTGKPVSVYARKEEGDPGCVRDYVYVDDVVRANLAALDGRLDVSLINICTGIGSSTLELAQAIKALAGSAAEIGYGPRRQGDIERSVLAPSGHPALGPPTDLMSGLEQTIDWFRDRG